ncbi:MAG: PrsW family intramembrane metalloprotease [Butyrivibrio sp.]|nr:PrsW family intramembrane metalloprotease [Butyrivibrio sp.]
MFCSKCGTKIEDGSAFCQACGAPVENTAAPKEVKVEAPASAPVQETANEPEQKSAQETAQSAVANAGATVSNITQSIGNKFADPNLKEIAAHPVKSFNKKVNELAGGEGVVELKFRDLFSGVFAKHSKEDAEDLFICGTSKTTPTQDRISTEWPKPWLFARIFLALFVATIVLYSLIVYFGNVNCVPGYMTMGSFLVPFSVLVFIFEVNAPRNISFYEVLKYFFVGGCLSLLVTLILFRFTGAGEISYLGAILIGVVEETGKFLVTAFYVKRTKKCTYILNGLLIGAAIGAGFAAFESSGYAFTSLFIGQGLSIDNATHTILLRAVLAPGGHVLWAAIEGAAMMIALDHKEFRSSVLLNKTFLSLSGICILMHGIWDMPFQLPFYLKYIVLIAASWIALIIMITRGLDEINKLNQISSNEPAA